MDCVICKHPKRKEIEQDLLLSNFGDSDVTFKSLADAYNVPIKDLKIHALMHMSLENESSIVDNIKLREADMLRATMEESLATMKNVGAKMNKVINEHTVSNPTFSQIPKQMVDLYLGCAQTVKETANSLVKMDLAINGDKDSGLEGLKTLVEVLGKPSGN